MVLAGQRLWKKSHDFSSVTDAETHFKEIVQQQQPLTRPLHTASPSGTVDGPLPYSSETSFPTVRMAAHSVLTSETASPTMTMASNLTLTSSTFSPSMLTVLNTCHQLLQPLEHKEKLKVLSTLFSNISGEKVTPDFFYILLWKQCKICELLEVTLSPCKRTWNNAKWWIGFNISCEKDANGPNWICYQIFHCFISPTGMYIHVLLTLGMIHFHLYI